MNRKDEEESIQIERCNHKIDSNLHSVLQTKDNRQSEMSKRKRRTPGNTFSDRNSTDSTGLSDNDVTMSTLMLLNGVFENVLRNLKDHFSRLGSILKKKTDLGGFSTSRGSSNENDVVFVNLSENFLSISKDGQMLSMFDSIFSIVVDVKLFRTEKIFADRFHRRGRQRTFVDIRTDPRIPIGNRGNPLNDRRNIRSFTQRKSF